MIYGLKYGDLEAEISSFGAELVSLKKSGEERIWQNENGTWNRHAPLLFPLCGRVEVVIGGVKYDTGFHGFARDNEFTLVKRDETSVTLCFKSDEKTKKLFPFVFSLTATYALNKDGLKAEVEVLNEGDSDMPFAFGSHEGYILKDDLDAYELVFEKDEKFDSLMHTDEGRLTGEKLSFGEGKVLPLPRDYLTEGRTVIFGDLNSRKVVLAKRNGEKIVEIDFEKIPNMLLWRPETSKMICIEPWLNLPDNDCDRGKSIEFGDKKGVITLKPERSEKLTRRIKFY